MHHHNQIATIVHLAFILSIVSLQTESAMLRLSYYGESGREVTFLAYVTFAWYPF